MKKSLLLGILGLAAGAATSYGQGFITLDNYTSTATPLVTFGAGSGGTLGTGLTAGWTAGIYFAAGNVAADATSGNGPVSGLLALGTGQGSTASFFTTTFNSPGQFFNSQGFAASAASGSVVTLELVAYNGASYSASTIRGHSAAFNMTTAAGNAPVQPLVGDFFSTFSVSAVPEPTTLALAGLGGLASLVMLRRKKA